MSKVSIRACKSKFLRQNTTPSGSKPMQTSQGHLLRKNSSTGILEKQALGVCLLGMGVWVLGMLQDSREGPRVVVQWSSGSLSCLWPCGSLWAPKETIKQNRKPLEVKHSRVFTSPTSPWLAVCLWAVCLPQSPHTNQTLAPPQAVLTHSASFSAGNSLLCLLPNYNSRNPMDSRCLQMQSVCVLLFFLASWVNTILKLVFLYSYYYH